MRVTISNVISKHDTFGCWSVQWENCGGDTGLIRVSATIMPDWGVLSKRLADDGYIDLSICNRIISSARLAETIGWNNLIGAVFRPQEGPDINKAIGVLKALSSFCEQEKQVIKKRAYSFLDALGGGNTISFEKAQKKILKNLILDGEDTVYNRLINYLRRQNAI